LDHPKHSEEGKEEEVVEVEIVEEEAAGAGMFVYSAAVL